MSMRVFIGLAVAASLVACAGSSEDAAQVPTSADRPERPAPDRLALVTAETPPPPISGGTLTVTEDGTLAVAADPDRDRVYVVRFSELAAGEADASVESAKLADAGADPLQPLSLDAGVRRRPFDAGLQPTAFTPPRRAEVATIMLSAGSEPGRVVLDGAGYVHVVLRSKGALARISLASHALEQESEVCKLPRGLSYDAERDAVWVACADGELVSLAAKTHAELTRSFVALDLRDVVVTKSGERFVSRYRSAELLHVGADGKVEGTRAPEVSWSLNGRGEKVSKSPTLAWRTAVSPDGEVIMLHQQAQNEPVAVEPGGYGGGECGGAIAQAGITQFDGEGAPAVTAMVPTSLAVDVAVAPGGKSYALAVPSNYLLGRGTLQVIPKEWLHSAAQSSAAAEASDAPRAGTRPRDEEEPSSSDCRASPSAPAGEAQVTALAYDGNGLLYAFSREPAELSVYELSERYWQPLLVQTVSLDDHSVRDTGHDLFHADVGGGLACASCHGEALDDGHVWTFEGFGPRRTQNMRGGISHTLPLHWEGDMQTFQHLVDEVMTGRMSGFRVEARYASALATWIDNQPELTIDARDAAARERGRALFRSSEVACATCHSGEMLTNNETVDVGTGGKFQVPSLLGLGLRAPYMHDGCAKTLTQRFEKKCGGGDKHGKTSQLSKTQVADLVAYLESL